MNISLTNLRKYEQPKKRKVSSIFQVLLFLVVIALLLATLVAGTHVYQVVSQQRQADNEQRVGVSLIANSVRMTDAIDSVGVGQGPEGQALVLTERLDTGNYETRIYEYQGNIVEEYAKAGTAYTPAKASQLAENEYFSFSYSDGLLTVNTDEGSANIALRSVRSGASS